MKNKISGFGRSFIAAAIMLTMLFSIVAPSVMAATFSDDVVYQNNTAPETFKPAAGEAKDEIYYVSLGESMTNGYILDDVYQYPGYHSYAVNAYPNKFAQWYADTYNTTVKHEELAMAGLRVEDLLFALDFDLGGDITNPVVSPEAEALLREVGALCTDQSEEEWLEEITVNGKTQTVRDHFLEVFGSVDQYTYAHFIVERWDEWTSDPEGDPRHSRGTISIAITYQNAVANADVITMSIGNCNFGIFFFNKLLQLSGFKAIPWDFRRMSDDRDEQVRLMMEEFRAETALDRLRNPELKDAFVKIAEETEALFDQYIDTIVDMVGLPAEYLGYAKDLALYLAISYADSYASLINRIVELNPDVEIVLLANMNTHAGLGATLYGEELPFGMGDVVGAMTVPSNAFLASYTTAMQVTKPDKFGDAKIYYAEELDVDCGVDTYSSEIYNPNNTTIRRRFIKDIVGQLDSNGSFSAGMIWDMARPLVKGMGMNLIGITFDDVVEFERALKHAQGEHSIGCYNPDKTLKCSAVVSPDNIETSTLAAYIAAAISDTKKTSGEKDGNGYITKYTYRNKMDIMISCAMYLGFETAGVESADIDSLELSSFILVFSDPGNLNSILNPIVNSLAKPNVNKYDGEDDPAYIKAMADYERGLAAIEDQMHIVRFVLAEITENSIQSTLETMVGALLGSEVPEGTFADVKVSYRSIVGLLSNNAIAKEEALEEISSSAVAVIAGILTQMGDPNAELIAGSFKDTIKAAIADKVTSEQAEQLAMLTAIPEIIGKVAVGDDEESKRLLSVFHLFARNIIGDGLGCHPSESGHQQLFEAVVEAYTNKYTPVQAVVDKTIGFIKDNYKTALGLALSYADSLGYIDAAIGAVDTAKAAIEALLAEIDGGVSAVAATNLNDTKDEAIAALEAAIGYLDNIRNLLTSGKISSIEDVTAIIDTAIENVYACLEVASNFIDNNADIIIESAYAAVTAAINEARNAVKEAVELIAERTYEELVEKLGGTYDQFAAVVMAIVNAYSPERMTEIYNMLMNHPAEVIKLAYKVLPYIVDYVGIDTVSAIAVIAYAAITYGDDIAAFLESSGEMLIQIVDEYGVYIWNFIKLYSDATGFTAKVENVLGEIDCHVRGEISALIAKINAINEALKNHVDDKTPIVEATLKTLREELDKAYGKLNELAGTIATQIPDVSGFTAAVEEFVNALINGEYTKLTDALNNIKVNAELITPDVVEAIENIAVSIENTLTEIGLTVNGVAEKVAEFGKDAFDFSKDVIDAVNNFAAAAEEFYYTVDAIAKEIPAQVEQIVTAIENAPAYILATIEYIYENAIQADYVADEKNSYYVALGDSVISLAPGYSYADLLAAYLNVNFSNLSEEGNILVDMLDVIEYNYDELAKADLITVGYSNVAALEFAKAAMIAGGADWKTLFGENVANTAEEIIAELEATVVKEIYDRYAENIGNMTEEDLVVVVDMATSVLEAYVYAYVSQVVSFPEVLNAIREASPDALVVIVSAYNAFENITIGAGNFNVELGKYFDYVTNALNLEAFAYALFNESTIYIDASDVETVLEENGALADSTDIMDYLVLLETSALLPTMAGQQYIFEQIAAALNVTSICDHKYDSKCDADCNKCGEVRIPAPHTFDNACDGECNICFTTRTPADHVYDGVCDTDCNTCGLTRDAEPHTFGEWTVIRNSTLNVLGEKVRRCEVCNYAQYELLPLELAEEAEAEESNVGVIVAITVPSVVALGVGAFSVVWFGVKKKTFGALVAAIKGIFVRG